MINFLPKNNKFTTFLSFPLSFSFSKRFFLGGKGPKVPLIIIRTIIKCYCSTIPLVMDNMKIEETKRKGEQLVLLDSIIRNNKYFNFFKSH